MMVDNGADFSTHDNVELVDFTKILFAAMAVLGLVALLWAFGAALSPTAPLGPRLPRSVAAMLHSLR